MTHPITISLILAYAVLATAGILCLIRWRKRDPIQLRRDLDNAARETERAHKLNLDRIITRP